MSIQYCPGIRVFVNFLGDTIADLKNAINTNLVTAGWTSSTISGGFQLTSGTSPQNLVCKVNLLDDGTNVTVQFQDTTGALLGFTHHVRPASNKRFNIIADALQFFVYVPNVSATGNGCVMGGVPWLPAFLTGTTTVAIWSISDESSSLTFRNSLNPAPSACSFIFNSNVATGGGQGSPQLIGVSSSVPSLGLAGLWFNNAAIICEPMLAYGTNPAAIPFIVGSLWDAALVMQPYQLDLQTVFDSHTYTCLTDNNANGSLFVAITT